MVISLDSFADVERQVTSWEYDAKEILLDLIQIGVVIKGLKKGGSFVNRHDCHDRMDEICQGYRKRRISTKKHTACSYEFVGDGQSRSQVPRKRFMLWNLETPKRFG